MSATITPPADAHALGRKDPSLRLKDYAKALEFYLSMPDTLFDRILFIENTKSDLSTLEDLSKSYKKKIEFISFAGNDHPPVYGRGYGEFKLLDYGISHATCLQENDYLWKVTGRLSVQNIDRLIESAPSDYGLYCDLRQLPSVIMNTAHRYGRLHSYPWIDLRLFSCRVDAYKRIFMGRYEELRYDLTHLDAEKPAYNIVKQAMLSEKVIPRFLLQPRYSGYGGFLNQPYESGIERYRTLTRAAFRRIAPWLWL
jgi:hypothetical protein